MARLARPLRAASVQAVVAPNATSAFTLHGARGRVRLLGVSRLAGEGAVALVVHVLGRDGCAPGGSVCNVSMLQMSAQRAGGRLALHAP